MYSCDFCKQQKKQLHWNHPADCSICFECIDEMWEIQEERRASEIKAREYFNKIKRKEAK
jgi:hypothetical protein